MFRLDEVVPWGRDFEEYVDMFQLGEDELGARLLGCADGPASFNAEGHRRGLDVVSCDPLYAFSRAQIEKRIDEASPAVLEQTKRNADGFVWQRFRDIDDLAATRRAAMAAFLDDYELGVSQGRYVAAGLPRLPFESGTFDLAVCSHFLFLYSSHLDADFHVAALRELLRCAAEVRVFPLLQLGSTASPHVEAATETLTRDGYRVSIERTTYEFQRGGNQMLRLRTS